MRRLMDVFAYDRSRITEELVESRYRASVRAGFHETFSSMFPAPRQRWVESLATDDQALLSLVQPTLIVHGRDDQVIPLSNSIRLLGLMESSQLHVFGKCGHWTQIEHAHEFNVLVANFLADS
jgi:pimeloyl-ACP methyl ester carboxylesterase